MSDLLRGLLLLLVLVALMAQLVGHLPARLCLLYQPVGHGFSLILQLPLLLEKEIKKKIKTWGSVSKKRQKQL